MRNLLISSSILTVVVAVGLGSSLQHVLGAVELPFGGQQKLP